VICYLYLKGAQSDWCVWRDKETVKQWRGSNVNYLNMVYPGGSLRMKPAGLSIPRPGNHRVAEPLFDQICRRDCCLP